MNLYLLGTLEHNRKVQDRKRAECLRLVERELNLWWELGEKGWALYKQEEFDRREEQWRRQRAEQKRAGRKQYIGSWRQRRGHGFGWRVVDGA